MNELDTYICQLPGKGNHQNEKKCKNSLAWVKKCHYRRYRGENRTLMSCYLGCLFKLNFRSDNFVPLSLLGKKNIATKSKAQSVFS